VRIDVPKGWTLVVKTTDADLERSPAARRPEGRDASESVGNIDADSLCLFELQKGVGNPMQGPTAPSIFVYAGRHDPTLNAHDSLMQLEAEALTSGVPVVVDEDIHVELLGETRFQKLGLRFDFDRATVRTKVYALKKGNYLITIGSNYATPEDAAELADIVKAIKLFEPTKVLPPAR
jgi:hypothetical protein